MTDPTTPPATPISVKAHAAPVVLSESTKALLIAGLAIVADRCMHSESAIAAVIAAGGALLGFGWGLYHRLRTWRALRFLANKADDADAVVGNPT